MAEHPIIWMTSSRTPDGYGDEARAFLRAMESAGMKPGLEDLSNWSSERAGLSAAEEKQLQAQERRAKQFDPMGTLHVHHYVPGQALTTLRKERGLNVARATFETDRMPAGWLASLSLVDEVWVPTQFNVETFARSGISRDKVKVLGCTMDFDLYDPADPDLEALDIPGIPEGAFVFLANFDFSERKGWRILLEAWLKAFSAEDPVCLVMKTASLSFSRQEIEQRIESFWGERSGQAAPMVVFNQMLDAPQMPSLYKAADAFVLPSRGEGWGRPYMEALAMGLPTIATNFSGHLEFVRPEHAWLVEGELVSVPQDAGVANRLYQGHLWFEADVEDLTRALRSVASDPEASRAKAAPAREFLLHNFSSVKVSERIAELTEDLFERKGESTFQAPLGMAVLTDQRTPGAVPQATSLQGHLEHRLGRRIRLTGKSPLPTDSRVMGILLEWEAEGDQPPYLILLDPGVSHPETIAKAAKHHIDMIVSDDPERTGSLIAAGLPQAKVVSLPGGAWGFSISDEFDSYARSVGELISSTDMFSAPPIGSLVETELEGRQKKVFWAPDFASDEWTGVLGRWCENRALCSSSTLVIWPGNTDYEQAVQLISGALPENDSTDILDILVLQGGKTEALSSALYCTSFVNQADLASLRPALIRLTNPLSL